MPLEITRVDPDEMRKTALLNRAKSDTIRAIYNALFELRPGDAKALIAEAGDDVAKLRGQLQLCAKRTGHDLRIVLDRAGGRVLFTMKDVGMGAPSSVGRSSEGPSHSAQRQEELLMRRDTIRDAALALARENPVVSAQEIVDRLSRQGFMMDTARPGTAVSAVVRNMDEFERVGQSQFRYTGG